MRANAFLRAALGDTPASWETQTSPCATSSAGIRRRWYEPCTLEAVRRVIADLRARATDQEELADSYTALLVMADVDPWGYRFREEIAAMLEHESQDLIKVSKTLREVFDQGHQNGRAEAIDEMLRRIFMRRLGRTLTEQEQQALARRTRSQDPEDVEDRALTLEGEALAAWLLDPNAK